MARSADITGTPGPMQAPPMQPMQPPAGPPPAAFAPRRAESPALSPSQGPSPGGPGPRGNGNSNNSSGWLTDLLSRASREPDMPDDRPRADDRPRGDDRMRGGERMRGDERPPMPPMMRPDDRGRPDDRAARNTIESLDSLSVDIARMIDHNAATELWDRYNRGERNVFTKRLYTMQGQKAFDEISKRYRNDREFKQTVDRYIGEFERLLEEVSRDDRGQVAARTYLTSETGKVYTMLAHAAGRFD
jgi:hypothetical protein